MQVSTDRLAWNDAHMLSRAKVHHVAVLTKFPMVFSGFYSTLVTKFGGNLTLGDNKCVMSSSSVDCNGSPDAWTSGSWDSLRTDDDEAASNNKFVTLDLNMSGETWEMQPVT